jgi:DNA-binding XRE family transcriptional regulator
MPSKSNQTKAVKFQPVAFTAKELAARKRAADPAFKQAYDTLETEFAALATLLEARREAGLTQADVAQRMGVSQPVLARIESSLGSRKHTPSLNTLKRYAEACGKRLVISMI